jgi:hypothetical protein
MIEIWLSRRGGEDLLLISGYLMILTLERTLGTDLGLEWDSGAEEGSWCLSGRGD